MDVGGDCGDQALTGEGISTGCAGFEGGPFIVATDSSSME